MKARVADGWLVVEPVTATQARGATFISATSNDSADWKPAYFAHESLRVRPPAAPGVVVNVRVRIGHNETAVGRLVL